MDYTYNEFLKDLGMGREVEFVYKDEKYYISNWGFWRFYDSTSEVLAGEEENIWKKVRLDGKCISEVWDLIEIATTY